MTSFAPDAANAPVTASFTVTDTPIRNSVVQTFSLSNNRQLDAAANTITIENATRFIFLGPGYGSAFSLAVSATR
jgi:hypothetical protein